MLANVTTDGIVAQMPHADWVEVQARLAELEAQRAVITAADLDLLRQWFEAIEDCTPEYLEAADHVLAAKVKKLLGPASKTVREPAPAVETVTIPVLWSGTMDPVDGNRFEVQVLAEWHDDKLILLTDDGQVWCMPKAVVRRKTDSAPPASTFQPRDPLEVADALLHLDDEKALKPEIGPVARACIEVLAAEVRRLRLPLLEVSPFVGWSEGVQISVMEGKKP